MHLLCDVDERRRAPEAPKETVKVALPLLVDGGACTAAWVWQHFPMTSPTTTVRPGALRLFVPLTAVLVLLVLVQAVLAGRYTAGLGQINLHGYIGNASFVVGFILAVDAVIAKVPKRELIVSGVVLLLLFVLTGLGYAGRSSAESASIHLPLGVVTFALVLLQHVWAIGLSRQLRGGSGSSS